MSFFSQLKLHAFRNYTDAALTHLSDGFIVLTGPNGAGKTNILEAISLLSPGRGLRGARQPELQNTSEDLTPWAISGHYETPAGQLRIGTGLDPTTDKRTVRLNGETLKSQTALADYICCLWLTPQMDRLFLDASSARRQFFDRIIFALDPGHAGRIRRYENALAQRSKILREHENPDTTWLDGLESQIAETGTAIAAARNDGLDRLQAMCTKQPEKPFPRARLSLHGSIEELLHKSPALEVEEMFTYQLRQSRPRDSQTGGAATGPHKTDLNVIYESKNAPAVQCSTGEQKALLIGLILAQATLLKQERAIAPILLLDEVAAHLDEGRRNALYAILEQFQTQIWLTGTDLNLFSALQGKACFRYIENATIQG